jgi:hypothetical protein
VRQEGQFVRIVGRAPRVRDVEQDANPEAAAEKIFE